ncbi:MAG TPA: DNA gyrase inhibitor YacG [Methylibium sp.]|uniref:DNA gyrase inhibitor YacG n=1 Tax=Methylibium sp. TaxID=2067992 RepID=UPI002DBDE866|nr:DNA gyrase inhibitor YacG [Methylibium sp.]HEU4458371.1 DNA gyrase inhibitor YacG [Methylibium sp.]
MSSSATPARRVRCPGCSKPCDYAATNPNRPFCSTRCKLGDLGAWAEERYRVEAAPPREDDDPADGEPSRTPS